MVITGNAATSNARDGLTVGAGSVVSGNTVSQNGVDGPAVGIRANDGGSRVEGQSTNGNGILALSTDVVVRNTTGGNTPNYISYATRPSGS